MLGQYGKDNAAAMFELFRETMPEYPIDRPDAEGNTGRLCVVVVVLLFVALSGVMVLRKSICALPFGELMNLSDALLFLKSAVQCLRFSWWFLMAAYFCFNYFHILFFFFFFLTGWCLSFSIYVCSCLPIQCVSLSPAVCFIFSEMFNTNHT